MKSIYEFLLKSKTAVSTQVNGCVDLDLPSGLLWARCNIGADEPYEYGDYFMWGSTEPDTNDLCIWAHAPFNNGSSSHDIAYFNSVKDKVCPNDILAHKHDAANIIMGDEWRLPTDDDFQELIDNTKHEWIKNYQGSSINGMLFTPKNAEAAKANGDELDTELFIPASGYRSGSGFNNRGSSVDLWSSSLDTIRPYYARNLYFSDSNCSMYYNSRCLGFCLRGVKEN